MIEFGIVGAKNSGKTTLVEKLIPLFVAQGLKVATVKHTGHAHTFDTPGKDSARHRQAGAELTMAIGAAEIALFARPEDEYQNIGWKIIAEQFDVCLVEGDKSSSRPKVFLTRNQDSLKGELPSVIVASYGADKLADDMRNFVAEELDSLVTFILTEGFPTASGEQTDTRGTTT